MRESVDMKTIGEKATWNMPDSVAIIM